VQDFVEHHDLGVVKGPEFAIRLGRQRRRRLPDLLFVVKSRADIVGRNHVEGPPDLIMEVVSPESVSRDWRDKYLDYQRGGVREYWVIDPQSKRIEAYVLNAGEYETIEEDKGRLVSTVLKGFYLRPDWMNGSKLAARKSVIRELGIS
jgi:Uma2 family endonuclease